MFFYLFFSKNYLNKYKFKNAIQDNLWESLQDVNKFYFIMWSAQKIKEKIFF